MTTKSKSTTSAITVNEIDNYLLLRERRLQLQREADELKKMEDAVAARFEAAVIANRSVPITKGKHTLALKTVPGRPSWKSEFIRVAGAAAALAVAASVPTTTKLTINGV